MMKLAFIVIALLVAGCSPSPPDDSEIERWFEENYESLNDLARLGSEHPALRRAEPALKKYTDYYVEPSEDDLKAEMRVFELVENLDIDFVAYSRSGQDNDVFFGMTVPYYRWGLGLGGYSKNIYFDASLQQKLIRPNSPSTYIYLNKPGWFINVSDTR